jgi:hypothetical protein
LRWAWDRVQVFWDRNILTFGSGEQMALIGQLGSALVQLESSLRARPTRWLALEGGIALLVVGLWWLVGRRGRPRWRSPPSRGPAAAAVEKVARRLRRGGLVVPPTVTVRWIASRASERWPQAAAALAELGWLAERELYGPGDATPTRGEVRTVEASLRMLMRRG